jgi:hypothetical protein
MQFSYNITEDDFVKAVRLRCRRGSTLAKTILFWIFILICLLLLWGGISRGTQSRAIDEPPPSSSADHWIPIAAISVGLVLVLQFAYYGPRRLRQLYQKDPAMHGRFTVDIKPESIGMDSTAGFTSRSGWNLYEFWSEKDDLIVLVLFSSAFMVLNTADMPEPQRAELRGILSSVIRRK